MTKKLDFEQKWNKLVEKVLDSWHSKLLDVEIMTSLDFSPSSWKVWKPKFVEKSRIMEVSVKNNDGEAINEGLIEYDKKKKLWKFKKYSFDELWQKTHQPYN
jgi:hypothetical protein